MGRNRLGQEEHSERAAPKGIVRDRLAIPVQDCASMLLAYCGRAASDERPSLTFPNGFDPRGAMFNSHRIG